MHNRLICASQRAENSRPPAAPIRRSEIVRANYNWRARNVVTGNAIVARTQQFIAVVGVAASIGVIMSAATARACFVACPQFRLISRTSISLLPGLGRCSGRRESNPHYQLGKQAGMSAECFPVLILHVRSSHMSNGCAGIQPCPASLWDERDRELAQQAFRPWCRARRRETLPSSSRRVGCRSRPAQSCCTWACGTS